MKPFEKGSLPPEAFDVETIMRRFNCTREQAEEAADFASKETIWINNQYQVNVTKVQPTGQGWPCDMIWLSIKRRDKEAIHDWRDLQTIKNMLVGPENEAVEIYPAESRLVDAANQFHLYVFEDPKVRLPFGFTERCVSGSGAAKRTGGKQRAFKS